MPQGRPERVSEVARIAGSHGPGMAGWASVRVPTREPTASARLIDAALALGVLVLGLGLMNTAITQHEGWLPRVVVVLIVALLLLAGAHRRSDPARLYAVCILTAVLMHWSLGVPAYTEMVLLGTFMVLAYEHRPRVRALIVWPSAVVLVVTALSSEGWAARLELLALMAGLLGWAQGIRRSREYRAGLVIRAEVAEREQELRAAQAVAEERARIARDIHDVVSHSLAVVVVQASGAERLAERDPQRAKEALGVIAETARGALTEMRAMLQVLRSGDVAMQDDGPSPGLPEIDSLTADMTTRGLPVHVTTMGTPYRLGPGPELAVFRVIQEALTNALKHGDRSADVGVVIRYEPTEVVVEITNSLRPAGSAPGNGAEAVAVPGSGSGLSGMRERLGLYGGRIVTGSDTDYYHVRATIPRPQPKKRWGREVTAGEAT